jgi:hypothetical protein
MRGRSRRALSVVLATCLGVSPRLSAQDKPQPTVVEFTRAIELSRVGDYEGVVRILEPLAPKLSADPATRRFAVQAYVTLATSQVALGFTDGARASFLAALRLDANVRLSSADSSPKILLAFNDALREFRATRKGSKAPLVVAGVGAAAVGVGLAASGGGSGTTDTLALRNLRFTTPVQTCPDGADNFPLIVGLAADLNAPGALPITLEAIQVTLVITASPGLPGEVGFASSLPSNVVPPSANMRLTTLTVETRLICGNGVGDAPRVNEFLARVVLTTPQGVVTAETPDRMRVNIP